MILTIMGIGGQEMVVILVVALLLFGGKKLPELARGLGKGIREFKDASEGIKKEISDQINNFERDIDVSADESDTKVVVQNKEIAETVEEVKSLEEASSDGERKFPQFTAPANTYQHDPGAHPVDEVEYQKYGHTEIATASTDTAGSETKTDESTNAADNNPTQKG